MIRHQIIEGQKIHRANAFQPVDLRPRRLGARALIRVFHGQLSFADREILTLRLVSDLAIADNAEVLGIKLSAAKMRLSRASARFAELLNPD